ncbi:Dedicator of cytokinesis protein 4 [Labeo rohita]|uniref:Dedicator of cytokinesis protein 4 n=1 Tax=Labeo rohita TaxID=84645 RepID=A0ABQ8LDL8_LABRO|nr:Dedicator of cytokinesis protein 4 [Labeo rohita]
MSPLENASEVIENKTLIAQCQMRQMLNIKPLTMCLNGVIDAAVNGGLARYQEVRDWMESRVNLLLALFAKDYITNHPEDGEKMTHLRELMFEQDMRPLHKKLVDQFHVMRSSPRIQPHKFPAYVRVSPLHFANGSPRPCTCRTPVPDAISPEGGQTMTQLLHCRLTSTSIPERTPASLRGTDCSRVFPSPLDPTQKVIPFQIPVDSALPRCEPNLPTPETLTHCSFLLSDNTRYT